MDSTVHTLNLVETGKDQRHVETVSGHDSIVHYEIYEQVHRYDGRQYIVMTREVFETMLEQVNELRRMQRALAPIATLEPVGSGSSGMNNRPTAEMHPCRRCGQMKWDGAFCECATPGERQRFQELATPPHIGQPQSPTSNGKR